MRAIGLGLGLGLVSMLVGSSASADNMIKQASAIRAIKQQLAYSPAKVPWKVQLMGKVHSSTCCSDILVSSFRATTKQGHYYTGEVTMSKKGLPGESRVTFNGDHPGFWNSNTPEF